MYNGYVPMKNMKWAICELERLQIQFDHPNPIRNASPIKKKQSIFYLNLVRNHFFVFKELEIRRNSKKDVMGFHMINPYVMNAMQSLLIAF